jgi:hypothetical protein
VIRCQRTRMLQRTFGSYFFNMSLKASSPLLSPISPDFLPSITLMSVVSSPFSNELAVIDGVDFLDEQGEL